MIWRFIIYFIIKKKAALPKESAAFQLVYENYCNNCKMDWGCWFAWASIACADCIRTLFFVNSIISFAISTSRIRDSAAVIFSVVTPRLLMVCSRRFWMAPNLPRLVETWLMASLILLIAAEAPGLVLISISPVSYTHLDVYKRQAWYALL